MLPNNMFNYQAFSMPTLTVLMAISQNMCERGKGDAKAECETNQFNCNAHLNSSVFGRE